MNRPPKWFMPGLAQPLRDIAWGDFLLAAVVFGGLAVGLPVFAIVVFW